MIPPVWSPMTLAAVRKGGQVAVGDASRAWRALIAELAGRFGAEQVLLTDSGTSALALAMGDPVLERGPVAMPCYSCFDLATAANQADVGVLLYDLDPRSLQPELASLERTLASGARQVVVVHLFGVPVDLGPVRELCRRFDAPVIEDAAQAFGAGLHSRPAGSFGDVSILSFNRGKGVSGGGGGALLGFRGGASRLREIDARLPRSKRTARPLAVAAAQWLFGRPRWYAIPRSLPFLHLGETVYRPPKPPARMSVISAALLNETIRLADRETAVRRRNAEWLRASLAGRRHLALVEPPSDSEPSYLRLPVLLAGRGQVAGSSKARRLGIATGYPTQLRDLEPLAGRILNATEDFPGATRLVSELLTCPTHAWLSETDRDEIRDLFRGEGG